MKVTLLSMFMALFIFTSCQKDTNSEEPPKPKCRLVKVTQGLIPAMDSVYQFKYNSNGLPSAMTMEFGSTTYFDWMDFIYKPGTTILEKVWERDPINSFLILFEYNAQNQLTKTKNFLGEEFTYQYNEKGQLSRIDTPKDYYYQTVFDNNGNLTECYRKKIADDSFIDAFIVEYSNMENTVGLLGTLNIGQNLGMAYLFPGSNFYPVPSKHLPKSLSAINMNKEPISTVRHTFERDASNNITKALLNWDNWFSITGEINTWKFEYDCEPQ